MPQEAAGGAEVAELVSRATNLRIDGWERGQAIRELASHAEAAEAEAARYREALETLTGKRITDGEGWATWAKNVARRALRAAKEPADA
jgi:hypothetical protein